MIELYEHNKIAYEKTLKMLEERNKCCVIHPTGTGKSYIALKWLNENKDKKSLIVTSSLSIISQFERTLIENGLSLEKDFPNLKLITYSSLMKDPYKDCDCIVLDEFHRAGAEKWGDGVNTLMDLNKDAKVLGLSATPVRYLDSKRNMADELFDGNVSSHITLPAAIAEGILPPPTYINAIYSFEEDLERIENRINSKTDEEEKKELEKELKNARRRVEQSENLPELFEKYMTKKDGKYLIFCRDIDHLEKMKDECREWFKGINEDIDVSYVHSEENQDLNKYTLEKFHYAKEKNLKLLFSVGMLNEGMHIEGIDGVIMLRPTSSPILYMQQLGRALTTGDKKNPLVFDIVNNIKCIEDIENLKDTVIKIMQKKNKSKEEIERMVRNFKIIDDYKEIRQLIKELDIKTVFGWDENYEKLKKFHEENGRFPKRDEECGEWLSRQRQSFKKGKLSEERIKKLEEIGKDWNKSLEEINSEKWEENYEKVKKFYEENGRFPTQAEECGAWLNHQRRYAKKGELSEERIKKLEEIDKDWNKSQEEQDNEQWEENYEKLKKFYEENGRFPKRDEECGEWLKSQCQTFKKGKLSEEKIKKLEEIGKDWNKSKEEQWEVNNEKLKKFYEENGRFPKIDEECGEWLISQRQSFKKGKLLEERIKKLEEIDKDWNKSQEEKNNEQWEENNDKLKKFYEKNGRFPKIDEECGKWLIRQRQSFKKGKLSEEKIKKLEEIDKDWNKSMEEKNNEKWNENYEKVKKFYEENGRFPKYDEECGEWLSKQRYSFKKGKLSEEIIKKLEDIDKNWMEGRKKVISVVNEANFLDLNQSSSDRKTKR